MIALIQRVKFARVEVNGVTVGAINSGLLLFLGVEKGDTDSGCDKLARRVIDYRVFEDDAGKMNLSLLQSGGEILVVSQFTLAADTRKGLRPSFSSAAIPAEGERLYQRFVTQLRQLGVTTATGQFGADMQVSLQNDGPVTFSLQL
ncbi:D-aminoacyl-tRNA deacylase [Corallincola spongiicola]|uniref:D-aminoacyl-tRNA deacylase n=1 Tax=Corallincola spongiicola TaxID=2520508 RepID=A0ABY1WPC6_9GAMM|nr:D-aminoacyl-tRNA deacylase [Corallincola spongiicola]TAA45954.1 D-tyrosyl-tRNA(Tyr) deacylase [Corallincola spongiicola]